MRSRLACGVDTLCCVVLCLFVLSKRKCSLSFFPFFPLWKRVAWKGAPRVEATPSAPRHCLISSSLTRAATRRTLTLLCTQLLLHEVIRPVIIHPDVLICVLSPFHHHVCPPPPPPSAAPIRGQDGARAPHLHALGGCSGLFRRPCALRTHPRGHCTSAQEGARGRFRAQKWPHHCRAARARARRAHAFVRPTRHDIRGHRPQLHPRRAVRLH